MQAANNMVKLNVRGKRKRREPQNSSPSLSRSPKPRGRPMKSPSELKAKKLMMAFPDSAPPARTQSWLERLPAELIEQIFLQALEVNMAKASPFLARTFSKESIYRMLILFAFFEDDGWHPVETKHFAPVVYRLLTSGERERLQQGIMECRWCTFTRIRQCLPTLRRLVTFQTWHMERECEFETAKVQAAPQQGEGVTKQPPSKLPSLDDDVAISDYFKNRRRTVPKGSSLFITDRFHKVYRILDVLYLPKRLLNPTSWQNSTSSNNPNPNPVDFLAFLFDAYIGLSRYCVEVSSETADPSAFVHGFETAIREADRKALTLLLRIHDKFVHLNIGTQKYQPVTGGSEEASQAVLGSVLPLATMQEGNSSWILKMLIPYRLEHKLQPYDKILTKWAIEKAQDGDEFAKTLLDMMAEK